MNLGPVLGRLAGTACFVALGLLHQCPNCCGSDQYLALEKSESRSAEAGRLDWWGVLLEPCGLGRHRRRIFIGRANLGWRHPLVFGGLVHRRLALWGARLCRKPAQLLTVTALFKNARFTGANLITLFLYAAVGIFLLRFR